MRILRKLTLVLVLGATVPLFVAGSLIYGTVSGEVHSFEQQRLQGRVQGMASEIDEFVLNSRSDLLAIAATLPLAMEGRHDPSQLLARYVSAYPQFSELMLIDGRGTILASNVPGRSGKALFEFRGELPKGFQEAIKAGSGEAFICDLSEELYESIDEDSATSDEVPDLEILTPLFDASGRHLGVLVGVAGIDHLVQLMRDIDKRLPGNGSIRLLDRNDHLLLATDEQAPPSAGQGHIAARQMTVRAVLSEYGVNRAGGWHLVVTVPSEAVVAPIKRMAMHGALLVLALLGIAAGVAAWLARSLSQPFVMLTRTADELTAGNYTVRANVSGSVEAKQLSTAFNNMAEAVSAKTLALEAEIKEREAQATQLREARFNAEAASRSKSEFLANMSHEIRTPMNGVLGFTNLLLDTPLDAEQQEFVHTIRHSGESLLHVINDILDFSKVEAGKLTIERQPFKLSQAAEEVAELLAPQAEKQGLELALKVAPSVPEYIEGDAGRVRQILLNLIGNAIKFTRKGHVLIEIDCQSADEVRCAVTDTGVGIAPEQQSCLFKEFGQADTSTTREFGGTGLGLVIAKRLIELMGGRIGFTSEPGKGSQFWFTLPAPAGFVPASAHTLHADLADMRVLIVDDLEINRRLLGEQLTVWGVAHECAASGREALEKLHAGCSQDNPFDVALLDFLMPGMDGLELGHRIKSDPALQSTALIMLTSGSQRSAGPNFLAAGFSVFMMKPVVRPLHLLDAITKAWHAIPSLENPAKDGPAAHTSAVKTTAALIEPRNAIRTLVAEDNAVNQLLIKRVLEKLGCRVDLASNGLEAVAMAQAIQYDIVLMDCSMPEMDGYQATAEIRRLQGAKPRLPVIALTAHAMPDDRAKCMAAGMDDYLSKPINPELVRKTLHRWVERAEDMGRRAAR